MLAKEFDGGHQSIRTLAGPGFMRKHGRTDNIASAPRLAFFNKLHVKVFHESLATVSTVDNSMVGISMVGISMVDNLFTLSKPCDMDRNFAELEIENCWSCISKQIL